MEQRTLSRLINEPIPLSALGRKVNIGDLYNYNNDLILPKTRIESPDKKIDTFSTCDRFYFKPDDKLKRQVLGISSHFNHSINNGLVDGTSLWFSDYLQKNSTDEDERNFAEIDVYFRFKQRTESINQEYLINSKMNEYQLISGGRATHLVQQVMYGAEFIFSMRRAVDRNETKENAEKSLFLSAKAYIEEAVSPKCDSIKKQPAELKDVICTNFCSLSEHRVVKQDFSIQESCEWLREAVGLDEEINKMKWQAVEIVLKNILDQIGARFLLDMENQFYLEKERTGMQFIGMQEESSQISKCSSFDYVPQSKLMIQEFLNLLPELEKKFNFAICQWNATEFFKFEFPEKVLSEIKETSILLADIIEWLLKREKDIEKIRSLLKDTPESMLDLSEIEGLRPSGNDGSLQVVASKKEFSQDPLLNRIKKFIQNQDSFENVSVSPTSAVRENRPAHYLKELITPSYPANGSEIQFRKSNRFNQKQRQPLKTDYSMSRSSQSIRQPKNVDAKITGPIESHPPFTEQKYPEFQTSVRTEAGNIQPLSVSTPSASMSGDAKDVKKEPNNGSQMHTEFFEKESTKQSIDQLELLNENSNGALHSESQNKTETTPCCNLEENWLESQSKKTSETVADPIGKGQFSFKFEGKLDNDIFIKAETRSIQTNPSTHQDENPDVVQEQVSSAMAIDCKTMDQENTAIEQSVPEKNKVAEIFTQEEFAKLIKEPMVYQAEPARMQIIPSKVSSSYRQQEERATVVPDQSSTIAIDCNTMDERSKPIERSIAVTEKKKIAEIFTHKEFATLLKDGQPMVYQLNTKERSVGKNLRYFDIKGQTETISSLKNSQNHKVIILMGATGSGKSTLINGMINYILGVQWKDPFRFKCIRDDSSIVRNAAHSQTDSVTAYTLHHREGMAIPYSITLIDTPGYGDTRGIERDKEITKCIHLFLTQQEIQIDQIHAICFVAASADSRLTPTQRYVLDSVLSIFGEDVKENIRLLVTFADNSTPPVVEACRAAHFPMTSPSAGVMFNKFNSSVLYAPNEKDDTDDLSIEEIFWNMGQRNYKSFFTMLENMNGCDLKSTRQVILNRQLLEDSLLDIEVELDVCFDTIEKLENRSLRENNSDRKLTNAQKSFELETAKAKVTSLLDKVNESGRVLDSVALRSHSSSAADYLSFMRSRVIEEQKPGYQIRLQTLTELQNLLKENDLEGRQKLPAGMGSQGQASPEDKVSQDNKSSRPAATVTSGSRQKTTAGKSNNVALVRHETPIKQSTERAIETRKGYGNESVDTNRIQSTGLEKLTNYHYGHHSNYLAGGAQGIYYYSPSNTKVISVQPGLAKTEDRRKDFFYTADWDSLSTVDKPADVDYSDQNRSELNTNDTYYDYEKLSKKSDKQGKPKSFFSKFFKQS